MSPLMKYFFGFSLSEEADAYARSIAEDLSQTRHVQNVFSKYIPHITLKVSFVGTEQNLTELVEFMEKFVLGRKAIPIQMKGFGHFNIGIIYWDVLQEDERLTTLQQELCDGLESLSWVAFNAIEPNGIPHVTVGEGNIRGRFASIYDYLKGKYRKGIPVQLDTIHLFQKSSHVTVWESVATWTLSP
jgi:2'-5' RNA ligase